MERQDGRAAERHKSITLAALKGRPLHPEFVSIWSYVKLRPGDMECCSGDTICAEFDRRPGARAALKRTAATLLRCLGDRFSGVPFYAKALRLARDNYRGRRSYFVTICCERRQVLFATEAAGRWLIERLLKIAANYSFRLQAYCLMPDHLHILVEGTLESCDLVSFIDAFKQRTAFEFKKTHQGVLWQKRYYDHILRPGESIEDVACYIWMNPVCKKLCSEAKDYALSGSQTIDWMKHSGAEASWVPPWKKPMLGEKM